MDYIKREYGLGIDQVNNRETNESIERELQMNVDDEFREDTIKTDKIE